MPSETPDDETQSFDTSQVPNPYTSMGEDSMKVSPGFVRSLSAIETIARDYVSVILKGESPNENIVTLANSSGSIILYLWCIYRLSWFVLSIKRY